MSIVSGKFPLGNPSCEKSHARFLAHVPAGIDFRGVTKPSWSDYAAWFVGQVVFQRFRVHGITPDDFVPMAKEFAERFIPRNVSPKLRDDLVKSGVLECESNGYYRPPTAKREGRCIHYRVGPDYRGRPIVPHPIRSPELISRVAAYRAAERAAITDPTHLKLQRWAEQLETVDGAPAGDPTLDSIATRQGWFHVGNFGRVNTPATTLAKQFRPFVRLAGHHLVSVDVSCSQPLLLAVAALSKNSPPSRSAPPTTHNAPWGTRTETGGTRGMAFVSGYCDSGENVDGEDGFLADCLSGNLYEQFQPVWRLDRDSTKLAVLKLIYGYPFAYSREHADGFRKLYPVTWGRITTLVRSLPENGLVRMMQMVESELMIRGVAARFMREYPRVPVLTCHDALLVPPSWAEPAEGIIRGEWRERYGIEPRVKVSPWTFTESSAMGTEF